MHFEALISYCFLYRGLDVKGVSAVINYDLANNTEDYVHRLEGGNDDDYYEYYFLY